MGRNLMTMPRYVLAAVWRCFIVSALDSQATTRDCSKLEGPSSKVMSTYDKSFKRHEEAQNTITSQPVEGGSSRGYRSIIDIKS